MLLQVIHPGTFASIQDLGRFSARSFGVPVGGAVDVYSHRMANLVVGNEANAATIEIAGGGFRAKTLTAGWLALAGTNKILKINDLPVENGRKVWVPPDAVIAVSGTGNYHYLAVPGGWQVPEVLGSRSYCKAGQFGGGQGRGLQAGNWLTALPWNEASNEPKPKWQISPDICFPQTRRNEIGAIIIRVLSGPEWDWWDASAHSVFFSTCFCVSDRRDRMGIRLESASNFKHPDAGKMLSSGVTIGAIQVPPDGQPFALLGDAQTTGGYPRMVQVAAADIPVLAQISSGQSLVFQLITFNEAVHLMEEREKLFRYLEVAVNHAR